ncbi:MAG: substrate-binding domain-containing protein [Sphaerochaetaceae bacterium]
MTIREIAEQSNVSIGTVDRVIHHRGGVNRETEKTILKIIRDNEYRANTFARNLKLGRHFHFAVLLPLFNSEANYWELVHQGLQKAQEELSSMSVSLDYYLFNREKSGDFTSKFTALRENEPDAILVAPLNAEEMRQAIRTPNLPPTCLIDSAFPSFTPLSTIAQNPFKGGFIAGKIIRLLAKDTGTFVCIQIHPDAFNSYERARGFRVNIEQDRRNTVVDMIIKSAEELPRSLEEVLGKDPGIKGIFTVSSITSEVASSLLAKQLKASIVLVGYDLVPANREALTNGSIDCIISQRPSFQGYTAIYQLYRKVVLGQEPESKIEIPIDIFFKENLIDTIE